MKTTHRTPSSGTSSSSNDARMRGPVDNPEMGTVIPLSARPDHEAAGESSESAGESVADNSQSGAYELHPARGYKWEDFAPEHVKSMVYGGRSPRVIEAVARIVNDEVVKQAPWIIQPIFSDAVERYCRAEARARLLSDHIFRIIDEQGAGKVPRTLWDSAVNADNAATKASVELGLTPIARARLAALTTTTEAGQASLEDLADRGAAIRARRQAALDANATSDQEVDSDA